MKNKLSKKECFYYMLKDNHVKMSMIRNEPVKKIWKGFDVKTMGRDIICAWKQIHSLYLKTNVFLLEDEFKSFWKMCL